MKKTLLLFLFLLAASSVFAAVASAAYYGADSALGGKTLVFSPVGTTKNLTDGNVSTTEVIGPSGLISYTFPTAVYIDQVAAYARNGTLLNVRLTFTDNTTKVLPINVSGGRWYTIAADAGTKYVNKIEFYSGNMIIGEVDARLSLPPVAPPTPINLKATALKGTVHLTWSGSTGAESYKIFQNGSEIGTSTTTSYTATGVTNNEQHSWQVSAINSHGESALTAAVTTKFEYDEIPPDQPQGLQIKNLYGAAELSWNANTEPDLAGYLVYVNGTLRTPMPITATKYTVNELTNGTTYSIAVVAIDKSENESVPATGTAKPDGTPPSKPSGLLVAAGTGKLTLSWNANTEPDLAGYYVYLNGSRRTLTPITATTYTFTGLTIDVTYTVAVTAVDFAGNESVQAVGTGTPIPPDTTPPGKPTGLKVTAGNGEALLEWTANPEPDVAGYDIFVDGVKWTTVPLLSTYTYMVQGLTNGETYTFTIRAVDTSGNLSLMSDPVTATLETTVPDRPKGLQVLSNDKYVSLSWSDENRMPVTHYEVYRNGMLLVDNLTAPFYQDDTVTNGNDYTYHIFAVNDDGPSVPAIGHASPREGLTDMTGVKLPFTVPGMLLSAWQFLRMYGGWILLALGVIFAFALLETPTKAVDAAAGRKKGKNGKMKADNSQTVLVGNKRVSKAEWDKESSRIRREMYDYLTKTGRIKERDQWVAKTGDPYKPQQIKAAKTVSGGSGKRSREGLIAKQVPAERGGKKYMTTVYVKPENYKQGKVIYQDRKGR